MLIEYMKGDATSPQGDGVKIIAHIVNTKGGWGAGFVVALSQRWPEPERAYRHWYKTKTHPRSGPFALGNIQLVPVGPTLWVANMIAQEGYGTGSQAPHRVTEPDDRPPIRYPALRECLTKLADAALPLQASIHMPRIGCALAGGRWSEVEPILRATLLRRKLPVTVYDKGPFNP